MVSNQRKKLRCAIYTRKSTEEGLDQEFNSLDAQREACVAYIASQKHEGWICVSDRYDDGGISGATLDRPAMQQLLADIKACKIDVVVVYKVDRLTRALADFAKIVETFDAHKVSFVSVTQQFNTTTSMGRLTLNVLLSFAQFEREVTAERIRDKIAASKKKGMWMGGNVSLGYDAKDRTLVINEVEAETVRTLFRLYLQHRNVRRVKQEADRLKILTKIRIWPNGKRGGGRSFTAGLIYYLLQNPIYIGRIRHKKQIYPGLHSPIIDMVTWDAVQATLEAHRVDRRAGTHAAEPSPLVKRLFDGEGNRFTPSHAVKNGCRYRYYIEQSTLSSKTRRPMRLAASEIEGVVNDALCRLLSNPSELLNAAGAMDLSAERSRATLNMARTAAQTIKRKDGRDRHQLMQDLIERVIVEKESIGLQISYTSLRKLLGLKTVEAVEAAKSYTIAIPTRLKSRGVELKFVMMDPSHQTARPDPILIKAVARAHHWRDQIMLGEVRTLKEIANREKLPERYVRRILELAFLAPDITTAILDGLQPIDLTVERITRQPLPLGWNGQRELHGFTPR